MGTFFEGVPVLRLPTLISPSPGDDTYLDIFRDISLMASDNPEKLTRAPSKHSTL